MEQHESTKAQIYRNLLCKLPEGPAVLEEAYGAIEKILKKVQDYVKVGPTR